MIKWFLFTCLLCLHTVQAEQIPLTLELATTYEERSWGLMKRSYLPEDQGMLFYQPSGCIWMFNTWIDLSIAFLDEKGVIIALTELKSYPEKMDPKRPVNNINEMNKYSYRDPVYQFFWSKRYRVPEKSKFALEMNRGWFKKHDVRVGDRLFWKEGSSQGYIQKKNP